MKSSLNVLFPSLTILLVSLLPRPADAGTRYKDIVFSSVTVTDSIQFASNLNIDSSNTALLLDFYEPTSDTLKLRPLVICIHGGSLVSGARSDMGLNCIDFAKRGYVAATIDYRLGIELPKGVTTILEALLRGVQDTKAAVRFFRANAAKYGIDTSQIYLEGSSAGSMVAVHYAYWNEDEIPSDVNQSKWGDIEGKSGNPGYSTAIKAIINYCGGIVNPTWVNAGEVPIASIDGLEDNIVPQDSGVSGDFGIMLYGGIAISRIATPLGIYNQGVYFPGQGHGGGSDSLQGFASNFFYTLMVLSSSSPQDFTSPSLPAKSLAIFRYDSYSFQVFASDKKGDKIILPQSMVHYSCDSRIGTIEPYGVFTPSNKPDSGYVYATLNNVTDSCFVKTYDFKFFRVSPKLTVTDTLRTLSLTINVYDADSVLHYLPITDFNLVSTDPSVGTVDSLGAFTAKKNGTTYIIASFNGYSDTSEIRVESASGLVKFESFESLNGWTFTGANLDSLSVTLATDQKSEGNASFRIDYKFTYDPSKSSYMVYLNKDLPVFGIPDSIYLDVKSDGRRHRLYYRFTDVDSAVFRASGKKYLNDSLSFDNVDAPMTGLLPQSGVPNVSYPLMLRRIEIQLAGTNIQGVSTAGTIYIDNLRLKYPGNVSLWVEKMPPAPHRFGLEQNYPNPFNPTTVIGYQLSATNHVTLKVYDVLGRLVRTLVSETERPGVYEVKFDGSDLSSGVYFYRLDSGAYHDTKKLLLVK